MTIDGLCILPLNIINEKIYVFLWFWFVFVALVSAVHVNIFIKLFIPNYTIFFVLVCVQTCRHFHAVYEGDTSEGQSKIGSNLPS